MSPNTLRAWERRFGYPKPQRSVGKHRIYTHGEVAALRDALQEGLSISSAISRAREALRADTSVLSGALNSFELDRADAAMEAALALRSVDRTVEEVLLPSLADIGGRHGYDSAPWAFAARWASEWLQRAHRLAPPPSRPAAVLIGDATRDELDIEELHLHALELFLARAGARVITLPISGVAGLGEVLGAFRPGVVVISGSSDADEDVARWAYSVRASAGALPIMLFNRVPRDERARTTGSRSLSDVPSSAHREILAVIEQEGRTDAMPTLDRTSGAIPFAPRRRAS